MKNFIVALLVSFMSFTSADGSGYFYLDPTNIEAVRAHPNHYSEYTLMYMKGSNHTYTTKEPLEQVLKRLREWRP